MKAFFLSLAMIVSHLLHAQQNTLDLFVGTYTDPGKSEGIYVYSFDDVTGDFTLKSKTGGIVNPSFLAFNANAKKLYAVSELSEGPGTVSSFSYKDGKLEMLNTLSSNGNAPCHIITDKANNFVFVANYGGGSLSVYQTNKDGELKQVQHIQYKGSGSNKDRQNSSHVHSSTLSPDEKFLLVQDLGTDMITVYPFSPEHPDEPLEVNKAVSVQVPPGSGPRHVSFSNDGKYVYVATELNSAVQVYAFKRGNMELIQELNMLPGAVADPVGGADIHLSSDGNFLYSSNRGNANEINIFKINPQTGKLRDEGRQSVKGIGPRNFAITKNGRFLLVANQNSDEIVIFDRNTKTGKLNDTGKRIAVGSPVCLIFN